MINLTSIKEESRNLVGFKLAKTIFEHFDHPNNRLIIGVSCLKAGHKQLAEQIFSSIQEEGPKENKDHHFAYVRSLVELAELYAEDERYSEAGECMHRALEAFPENMGYMMSRVHLKVYHAYYCYQGNKKEQAYEQISTICNEEKERFSSVPVEDAYQLVGPGLCYAIHQWALFYAQEHEWIEAIEKIKECFQYISAWNEERLNQAKVLEVQEDLEQAFYGYEEAILDLV